MHFMVAIILLVLVYAKLFHSLAPRRKVIFFRRYGVRCAELWAIGSLNAELSSTILFHHVPSLLNDLLLGTPCETGTLAAICRSSITLRFVTTNRVILCHMNPFYIALWLYFGRFTL